MSISSSLMEFRESWIPHISSSGLTRLVGLIESRSPLLIHGSFTRACAMGCLATHIAWHHPRTEQLSEEAGIIWLTRVAHLNPATSQVILEWDRSCTNDWQLRNMLLEACREELDRRECELDSEDHDEPADACYGY